MSRHVLLLLTVLLAACGQAGDLYLPTEPPAQPESAAPAAPAPEPADKKKD